MPRNCPNVETKPGSTRIAAIAAGLAALGFVSAAPAAAQCPFEQGSVTVKDATFTNEFRYLAPGKLFPPTSAIDGNGNPKHMTHARYVALPRMTFPFKIGNGKNPAFMQSIVFSFGGCAVPGTDHLDKRNLKYPDRDNFGEIRDYRNPFASNGKGHQGCDVRNPSAKSGVDEVVAVEVGRVVKIDTSGGAVTIQAPGRGAGGSGTQQVYRHLKDIWVSRDDAVVAGQPLGLAGARMGGSDNGTKPHLHFEIRVRTFVLPASSIGGELNLESSSWDIVLPCYSSLIAAKMRALGLTPNLVGDELRPDSRFEVTEDQFLKGDYAQKPSPPAEDQVVTAPPDGKRYDSYWTIERPGATDALLGSVRGANDAVELYLLTPRETMFERRARSRSRPGDELVFKGQIVRDLARPPARAGLAPDTRAGDAGPARLVGKLTWLDPNENTASRCPSKIVDASGPILEKPVMRYDLTARTPIYDASCRETGEQAEVYSILYYGASPPGGGQASDAPVVAEKDRKSIVEVTRNWGAITLSTSSRPAWLIHAVRPKYPNDPSRINIPRDDYRWVYVGAWPGLRPDGERTDQFGGTVPAFSSDEAGVALWWFWTKVRKASRFKASGNPTFREIARIYGGDNASDATIQNYLTAYVSLGRHYFRNGVPDPDQPILLADPEQRFALAWTMFHHEAGRTPLIDRATFDRGVRMGVDLIQGRYVRYCDYLSHGCGGAAAPPSIPAQPEPGVPVAPPPVAEATPIHPLPTPPVPQPDQPELTALRRENSVLKNRLEQANTRIDTLERKLAASVSASPRPPSGAPTPPATNIKWRHNCRSGSHWLFCTSR